MSRARPRSSRTSSSINQHLPSPKQYRVNDQDVYSFVKNTVYQTFKVQTSRTYNLITEMTNDKVPQKKHVIDRMCKKFSILKDQHKNKSFEGANIDVEAITKHYIKSRSRDKQKQQERKLLKAQISQNYRYGPNKQYHKSQDFFSFKGNDLSNLQKKKKQNLRKAKLSSKKTQHPYFQLYENAQSEVLTKIKQKKDLTIFTQKQCPQFPEMDDWEKNIFNVQKMVAENKSINKNNVCIVKQRNIQSARPRLQKKPGQLVLS